MHSEEYRESLKDAIQNLVKVNESIFQAMVPVLMTGEMKEWSAEVPIGEVHNFEWELFKNSTDTNIQLLVKVIEVVDETYLSLQNINDVQVEEKEE